MVKQIQNRFNVDGVRVTVALLGGVPLKAWSDRCFMELGGLIREVILVDEDTKSKLFLCEVEEEEWRMDPDWWLAREWWNLATESDLEDSSDSYNDTNLNVDGFLGDDDAVLTEERAATNFDVHACLSRQGILAEKNRQVEGGKMEPTGMQHCQCDREKKYKSVGEIYVAGSDVKQPRDIEPLWLELDEVSKLFEMGQRLGIQCQQNEVEVFTRLIALEERDAIDFKGD
ncbi:hypothetical protein SLEP1_g56678 [Rubroshorea leprosula]|uniref:Uncharacterized protein n=1 Tax=Rubroshorea leprosula TaxID=152421 RepID=A0AAV5MMX8_9ROSI|nr:hypothetical protein SLEP1_g56678 [Rubroshorea leprosula]